MNREQMVFEFNKKAGQPLHQPLTEMDLMDFRFKLILEEINELETAIDKIWVQLILWRFTVPTKEVVMNLLKELADVQYVLSGFAVTYGLPIEEAFRRVHESNMSKLEGVMEVSSDGKVLKGANYQKPDLSDLV